MNLTVRVTGVRLIGDTSLKGVHDTMAFTLAPDGDEVELSNGARFSQFVESKKIRASMTVHERSETEDKPVGVLQYVPPYDLSNQVDKDGGAFAFTVRIPSVGFNRIWNLILRDKLPSTFTFRFDGMTYGYSPDGDEKLWEVTGTGNDLLIINSVGWGYETTRKRDSEDDL
ncbi:MAG: hypothetical protein IKE60_26350 [Reyranella sp.]|uniref:hypothetical protein n=1 Tax=Reyranella sp. TaxID=1929291 RepID=UPI0025E2EC1F|nr:hypothetical protein [Reyranella sp.]MBR2818211.1 hypothetical protein [Reyranella sp.]